MKNKCRKLIFVLFSSNRVDLFVKKQNCRNLSLIADLQTNCRSSAECLYNICRISAECLQSVCSDDLQQVCKFADALQTKSAYHVKQRTHKMHQSNNVYLKNRQEAGLLFIKSKHYAYENDGRDAGHKKSP